MMRMPIDIGTIHFVGIGGIGMSGIAEVLKNLGYKVQGSDLNANANVQRLRGMNIDVAIGHREENLGDARVLVISSAVKDDNPEVRAARANLIPIVRRAEMLAELMRLKWSIAVGGTHGKTTTTSMVAAVLDKAGIDPTVINGGIINAYGTNARLGAGDWMVAEADESDGSFVKLPATIAIVTNIDPEHLDFYGDFDGVRDAFLTFVENTPFYGMAVMCIDHPEVQSLVGNVTDRRIVTYGFSPQADIRATDLTYKSGIACFDVQVRDRRSDSETIIRNIELPMPGQHNVLNCLSAIAVALELGVKHNLIRDAFSGFEGVKRRFTRTGVANGVTVIDDYGHHPVEISAVLKAARAMQGQGQLIAVCQPHRYTRLRDLFEDFSRCFDQADHVLVAPVYEAGESPIEGFTHDSLVASILRSGHRGAETLDSLEELPAVLKALAEPGAMVVCLGAGDITKYAADLSANLSA